MCAHHSHTHRHTPGGLEGRRIPENCPRPGAVHCTPLPPLPSDGAGCGPPGKGALHQPVTRLPFDLFPPGCVCGLEFLQAFFFNLAHMEVSTYYRFPAFISFNYKNLLGRRKRVYEMPGKAAEAITEGQVGGWGHPDDGWSAWCTADAAASGPVPQYSCVTAPASFLLSDLHSRPLHVSFSQAGPGRGKHVKLDCGGWGMPQDPCLSFCPGPILRSLYTCFTQTLVPLICSRRVPRCPVNAGIQGKYRTLHMLCFFLYIQTYYKLNL